MGYPITEIQAIGMEIAPVYGPQIPRWRGIKALSIVSAPSTLMERPAMRTER